MRELKRGPRDDGPFEYVWTRPAYGPGRRVVYGRCDVPGGIVRRSRAPGPHARGNTAAQVMDGLWTEANTDPGNNQHNPNTPTTGRC